MSSPIFLSNEQLNALFNQRDSIIEDSKQSARRPDTPDSKQIKPSIFKEQHKINANHYEDILASYCQTNEELGNRNTDQNSQMILISKDEYYQMKGDYIKSEGVVLDLRKELNQQEERLLQKNKEIKDLKSSTSKNNQVDNDSGEVNILKCQSFVIYLEKNLMLIDQNQRLSIQMKDLLGKNKELEAEGQKNYDSMLNAKLDQQDSKLKLLALQKDQRKAQNKYETQFGRLEKDIEMLKQKSEANYGGRESMTASNSQSSAEEYLQSATDIPLKIKISPLHQWKSNIVYGTQSPNLLAVQKVSQGNGAVFPQHILGKSIKDPLSPKKQFININPQHLTNSQLQLAPNK